MHGLAPVFRPLEFAHCNVARFIAQVAAGDSDSLRPYNGRDDQGPGEPVDRDLVAET